MTKVTQVFLDSSAMTVKVEEPNAAYAGAHYELAIKAQVNEVPSAFGYASF